MVEFVTSLPPKRGSNGRIDWAAVAAACRKHPGQWALVADDVARSTAHQIRIGKVTALRPTEDWEASVRTTSHHAPHRSELYLRFVGDK